LPYPFLLTWGLEILGALPDQKPPQMALSKLLLASPPYPSCMHAWLEPMQMLPAGTIIPDMQWHLLSTAFA